MIDSELSTEQRQIASNEATRAVLADALTEAGDPRGEFINVQLRLAGDSVDGSERRRLRARERQLLSAHGQKWLRGFPRQAMPTLRRGFIEHVAVNLYLSQERTLSDVARRAPLLESLELFGITSGLAASSAPGLDATLAAQVGFAIRELRAHWPALDVLGAHHLRLQDAQLAALLEAAPSLTSLDASANLLGPASARRLALLPLRSLALGNNPLGISGGAALLQREGEGQLVTLDLSNVGLTGASLEGAGGLEALEVLELGGNTLSPFGFEALAAWHAPRLRLLGLSNTGLDDAGAVALTRMPGYARLERLDVRRNTLKAKSRALLVDAGSPSLVLVETTALPRSPT